MSLKEAEVLALSVLKQVMEEKVRTLLCQCVARSREADAGLLVNEFRVCTALRRHAMPVRRSTDGAPASFGTHPQADMGGCGAGDADECGHCVCGAAVPPLHHGGGGGSHHTFAVDDDRRYEHSIQSSKSAINTLSALKQVDGLSCPGGAKPPGSRQSLSDVSTISNRLLPGDSTGLIAKNSEASQNCFSHP